MAGYLGSIPYTGYVAPTDTTDTFAVTDERFNRGGYRSVADETARLAITPDRRVEGMIVKQLDTGDYWTLDGGILDANWSVLGDISNTKVYQLYQPDETNPFVYTDNGGVLHIDGGIVQSGSSYETHAEQVYTTKDIIYTRDGAVAGLSTGELTGIQAKLYDGVNDGQLVFDNNGIARVGDVGNLQPLATREEVPTDGLFAKWSATNTRFETSLITESDISDLQDYSLVGHTHPYVSLTGNESIDGIKTFTSFPVTPSLYPSTDYQVANKIYVDNAIGGGDYLDRVIAMQQDATLSPGMPNQYDRYIILDASNLHANFGTIAGLEDNDIIEYNGTNFIVLFDASTAVTGVTVTVGEDINGNTDHQWYYNTATGEWLDRGDSGIEDYITSVFPIGLEGNVFFINEDNQRTTDADFIVKSGLIVETAAELTEAQGEVITFQDIFDTWYLFSHYSTSTSVLDSVYIGQSYSRTPDSITGTGTTATVTLRRHGFETGNDVTISGATQSEYNVVDATITVIDLDTFTYTTSSTVTASPATGSLSITETYTTYDDCPTQSPRHFPASDPLNTVAPVSVDDILDNNGIWTYDDVNDQILCSANYNTVTGFVSNTVYDNYDLTVTAGSTNNDDDSNGVVLAFVTDPDTGFEYTLMLLRRYNSTASNLPQYGIVYNYAQNRAYTGYAPTPEYSDSTETIIKDGSALVTTSGQGWATAGDTIMNATRDGDIITVKISQQGSASVDDSTELSIDLKDYSKLTKFRGPTKFGFFSASQASSYFKDLDFSRFGNYIFYNNGTTHDTYEYNTTTSTWSLQDPQVDTAHSYFGVGRIVESYLFNKLYFIENDGTINKIVSPENAAFNSPLTTKGDLLTYSTEDVRLPVGTNGQVLSADSTEVTGLKWVDQSSGMVYPSAGIAVSTGSAWGSSISGTSSQFVKADGSLDSNSYLTSQYWESATGGIHYSSGNVGIGTIAPVTSLDIKNAANSLPSNTGTVPTGVLQRLRGAGASTLDIGVYGTGGKLWIQGTAYNDLSQTRDLLLNPNGGNVGIGTSSPFSKLVVYQENDTDENIVWGHETGTNAGVRGFLGTESRNSIIKLYNSGQNFGAIIRSSGDSYFNGGNVGIGTNDPILKLSVQSDVVESGLGTGHLVLNGNTDSNKRMVLGYDTTNDYGFIMSGISGTGYRDLILQGRGGDVGINTLNPSYKLDVSGTGRFTSSLISNSYILADDPAPLSNWNDAWQTGFYQAASAPGAPTSSGWYWGATFGHSGNSSSYFYGGQIAFENTSSSNNVYVRNMYNSIPSDWVKLYHSGNANLSTIDWDVKNLIASGTGSFTGDVTAADFVLSSDIRLKENIESVTSNTIDSIGIKKFNFKKDVTKRIRYGIIAQDLEKIYPEMVHEDADGYKQVSYTDFLLVKIANLENRIKQLEEH